MAKLISQEPLSGATDFPPDANAARAGASEDSPLLIILICVGVSIVIVSFAIPLWIHCARRQRADVAQPSNVIEPQKPSQSIGNDNIDIQQTYEELEHARIDFAKYHAEQASVHIVKSQNVQFQAVQ